MFLLIRLNLKRTPLEEAVLLALQGGRQQSNDSNEKIAAGNEDFFYLDSRQMMSVFLCLGLSFKEQLQQMQEMNRLKAHLRYQVPIRTVQINFFDNYIVVHALLPNFRATIFFAFPSSNSFQTGCRV